jgi:hypothetical protein
MKRLVCLVIGHRPYTTVTHSSPPHAAAFEIVEAHCSRCWKRLA